MIEIYEWHEVEIGGPIIVKECPLTGELYPSRLENCKSCENFVGFQKSSPTDNVHWEYRIVCRAPLSRSALKVR